MKAERSRQAQLERNRKAIYNTAIRLHAKRMIARMNRDVVDPSKVIYDPETKEWRKITEDELSDNMKNIALDDAKDDSAGKNV